jgi:hypothetical protein
MAEDLRAPETARGFFRGSLRPAGARPRCHFARRRTPAGRRAARVAGAARASCKTTSPRRRANPEVCQSSVLMVETRCSRAATDHANPSSSRHRLGPAPHPPPRRTRPPGEASVARGRPNKRSRRAGPPSVATWERRGSSPEKGRQLRERKSS